MSPVQANTRMSDRRGTRAMSLRIRLPPSEGRAEGSRDAEDLVDPPGAAIDGDDEQDRKSTRLNSSHLVISYAVFCLKKKKRKNANRAIQAETQHTLVQCILWII